MERILHRQQLVDWMKKKYIRSLAGGYYFLADRIIEKKLLFTAMNKL